MSRKGSGCASNCNSNSESFSIPQVFPPLFPDNVANPNNIIPGKKTQQPTQQPAHEAMPSIPPAIPVNLVKSAVQTPPSSTNYASSSAIGNTATATAAAATTPPINVPPPLPFFTKSEQAKLIAFHNGIADSLIEANNQKNNSNKKNSIISNNNSGYYKNSQDYNSQINSIGNSTGTIQQGLLPPILSGNNNSFAGLGENLTPSLSNLTPLSNQSGSNSGSVMMQQAATNNSGSNNSGSSNNSSIFSQLPGAAAAAPKKNEKFLMNFGRMLVQTAQKMKKDRHNTKLSEKEFFKAMQRAQKLVEEKEQKEEKQGQEKVGEKTEKNKLNDDEESNNIESASVISASTVHAVDENKNDEKNGKKNNKEASLSDDRNKSSNNFNSDSNVVNKSSNSVSDDTSNTEESLTTTSTVEKIPTLSTKVLDRFDQNLSDISTADDQEKEGEKNENFPFDPDLIDMPNVDGEFDCRVNHNALAAKIEEFVTERSNKRGKKDKNIDGRAGLLPKWLEENGYGDFMNDQRSKHNIGREEKGLNPLRICSFEHLSLVDEQGKRIRSGKQFCEKMGIQLDAGCSCVGSLVHAHKMEQKWKKEYQKEKGKRKQIVESRQKTVANLMKSEKSKKKKKKNEKDMSILVLTKQEEIDANIGLDGDRHESAEGNLEKEMQSVLQAET